jgi:hypothetical protein
MPRRRVRPTSFLAILWKVIPPGFSFEYRRVGSVFHSPLTRLIECDDAIDSGMVEFDCRVMAIESAPSSGNMHSCLVCEGGSIGINEFFEAKYSNRFVSDRNLVDYLLRAILYKLLPCVYLFPLLVFVLKISEPQLKC